MNKKDVSRRGFLKGIFQTASGIGLATILKFVPEARGVLADDRSSVKYDVWPLPFRQVEGLKQRASNDSNTRILRDYLNKRAFEEVPGVYFAFRAKSNWKDENGNLRELQTDILFVGCSNNKNKGALLALAVDSGSSQWQSPISVIQDEAMYYIKDGEVTAHEDREHPLISASWFSAIVEGVSPIDSKSPSLDHGPCSNVSNQCIILSAACIALAAACFVGCTPCCVAGIGACASGTAACGLTLDCCLDNPGTHDC